MISASYVNIKCFEMIRCCIYLLAISLIYQYRIPFVNLKVTSMNSR